MILVFSSSIFCDTKIEILRIIRINIVYFLNSADGGNETW